ncbi:hypothetical protein ACOSZE_07580 [Lysinibacillus fusiformis]|uniref:hypothetical protein n=2 Tax=Bacillaceae TaxID=186817 RepID=UPI003B9FFD1D
MRTHRFIAMSLLASVVLGCMNEELAGGKLAKISISNSVEFGSVHSAFMKEYED